MCRKLRTAVAKAVAARESAETEAGTVGNTRLRLGNSLTYPPMWLRVCSLSTNIFSLIVQIRQRAAKAVKVAKSAKATKLELESQKVETVGKSQ